MQLKEWTEEALIGVVRSTGRWRMLCQCLNPRVEGVSGRNDQLIEMNDTG